MRVLPPHMFFASILLIAALNLLYDTPRPIPGPFGWILGGLLLILGLAITLPSARLFHRVKTNIMTYNDPNELVMSGWFRHTRNPIYLGMVVVLAGISIGFGELVGYAVPLIFLILMDRPFIPMEETAMQRVFGARYASIAAKFGAGSDALAGQAVSCRLMIKTLAPAGHRFYP